MQHYTVSLVKDRSSANAVAAAQLVMGPIAGELASSGSAVYGSFLPLFGLASNELYIVTTGTQSHDPATAIERAGLLLLESIELVPTVRPTEHSPRSNDGIYVFRWFDVWNRDIEEIARLSDEAWTTFEGGFNTEVQGLFRQPHPGGEQSKMLLITWYQDLSVWEASRRPAPAARENFQRRAQLTIEARPIATRLYTGT